MEDIVQLHHQIINLGPIEEPSPGLQRAAVNRVLERWPRSDLSEARLLVEIMEGVSSTAWSNLMGPAYRHEARHWRLLLEHEDRIYERIADAAAKEDGLTTAAPD